MNFKRCVSHIFVVIIEKPLINTNNSILYIQIIKFIIRFDLKQINWHQITQIIIFCNLVSIDVVVEYLKIQDF